MAARLEIDALRALQGIVAHGGVTRAAEHLSLSQSAVSHRIKRLEESIGSELLNRQPGPALLTEEGSRLLSYADRILSLHDEALLSLSKRSLAGKIRLGMTEDMTGSGLSSILARFARLFPEVYIRTHVAQSLVLQDELKKGKIDLAVMQVFASDVRPSDRVLYEDRLCWAKAEDLKLDLTRPVPFLSYDDNCFYRNWMLENVSSQVRQFQTVLECTSNVGILSGIEAGLGVSIISRRHVSPGIEEIFDLFSKPPKIAYVVRMSTNTPTHALKALLEEVDREAGDVIRLDA
jgi:DNA-binding transcriptional LysR family regulator